MPVSEKLVRDNHILWKAQVLTVLRGAQLTGFIEGTNPAPPEKIKVKTQKGQDLEEISNPAFESWKAPKQQVLSYLLTSVSRDVLVQVTVLPSGVAVLKHIEKAFASQSHARAINTRMALVTTQKGSMTVAKYVTKMKSLADDMASGGKKLDNEEIASYILTGLDYEYNSVVSSIAARVDPISFGELYSRLLAHETRLDLQSQGTGGQSQSLVNIASRGRGGFTRGRGPGPRGGSTLGGRGRGDSPYKPRNKFPRCQICGKTNHSVFKCYKRFDPAYMGKEKNANVAMSYGVDSNWYADSGATDQR
jgi:hypothetical protein